MRVADDFDVIVAGGGIAGLTAGHYAARLGRRTLILTGDVLGGHLLSIEKIDGYPGYPDGIAGYDLCPMTEEQAAEAGARFAPVELQRLDEQDGRWRAVTGEGEYRAGAVIVATGTTLKALGVPGEERLRGKGVSHCASCDAPLLRDQVVAVVGGGDSAMQEALTLAQFAAKVVILHRGAALAGQAIWRARVAAQPKIEVRFNTVVDEILGDQTVGAVRLRDAGDGRPGTLEAAAVFVYVGLQPNTVWLAEWLSLDFSGRVPTDTVGRSQRRGLFAAGSVRAGSVGQAVACAGDGAAAALGADRYLADGGWPEQRSC